MDKQKEMETTEEIHSNRETVEAQKELGDVCVCERERTEGQTERQKREQAEELRI